jgi:multidrug transporter EmrE-like cation transporter
MKAVIIILLISLMETFAQYFLKKYHKNSKSINYILGITFYIILSHLILESYKHSTMGITQILTSGLGIVGVLFSSLYVFNEKLSFTEWIGVLLIIIGMLITQYK